MQIYATASKLEFKDLIYKKIGTKIFQKGPLLRNAQMKSVISMVFLLEKADKNLRVFQKQKTDMMAKYLSIYI